MSFNKRKKYSASEKKAFYTGFLKNKKQKIVTF